MHFNSSLNRVIVVLGILVIGALVMPRTGDAATVTACVHKSNGNVRIVDNPSGCNSNETPLALSTPGGGVTDVTASAPLVSSGGSTPDISLPNVIIGATNTAVGNAALVSNTTGEFNTAAGVNALASNTTGCCNSASGHQALFSNTTGEFNTASGVNALFSNTTGYLNSASGHLALLHNTTGCCDTASGTAALFSNTTGAENTANGFNALYSNTTGSFNTAVGSQAGVAADNLSNATAIGYGAVVDASNKIRLGNAAVAVIQGQVAYTFSSDITKKENFRPVSGEEVLKKIGKFNLPSWNYIGHDPQEFRHYGPMAQEFFAAFGHDEVGTFGTPTSINSGDMAGILMIAAQALEKRTREQSAEVESLKTENELLKTRLEALEKSLTK